MLKDYPKAIVTKDGDSVLLRPVTVEDEEALNEFFSEISDQEQWFLREKLNDPKILHESLKKLNYKRTLPIVAVREKDGKIVANLRLHLSLAPSIGHVAHLRVMVHPDFRSLKIGSWMILDCVKTAMDMGLEKLFAEFVAGAEDSAIGAALKLDFRHEGSLKDYIKDKHGGYRDLVIMSRDLQSKWSDF
ncbi:MAG: N-acetyltransferase family protein [Desulfomonilaceae bacterium]|jgi:L-amino acid N-acyltransferase YncA|nr:GNAT family protein [Syntrophaceae bacterium]